MHGSDIGPTGAAGTGRVAAHDRPAEAEAPLVRILTRDPALRRALHSHLAASGLFTIVFASEPHQVPSGEVVIVPTSDCPPQVCRELSARQARVVLLAAIPGELERSSYIQAGAVDYIPMLVGPRSLVEAVAKAIGVSKDDSGEQKGDWLLLSEHGLVLVYLGANQDASPAEISEALRFPPERVAVVIADLLSAGFLQLSQAGRGERYSVNPEARFLHPAIAHLKVEGLVGGDAHLDGQSGG